MTHWRMTAYGGHTPEELRTGSHVPGRKGVYLTGHEYLEDC
jgi:hypothetical protein